MEKITDFVSLSTNNGALESYPIKVGYGTKLNAEKWFKVEELEGDGYSTYINDATLKCLHLIRPKPKTKLQKIIIISKLFYRNLIRNFKYNINLIFFPVKFYIIDKSHLKKMHALSSYSWASKNKREYLDSINKKNDANKVTNNIFADESTFEKLANDMAMRSVRRSMGEY